MRFRLAPRSVTLDALERPKRPLAKIKSYYGAHHKNFNEDRLMLSAAKCRPMDIVSGKIKYGDVRGDALRIGRQRSFRTRQPEFR